MTNLKKIVAAISVVLVLVVGAFVYSVFKTPAAASGPITAIPLAASAATSAGSSTADQAVANAVASSTVTTPVETEAVTSQTVPSATSSPSTATPQETTTIAATASVATNTTAAGTTVFTIVPAQSQVHFSIDEVLNGAAKTAIGTTNQVAGEVAIDPQKPTASRVGTIQVDVRTLATDNDFRNRAIKNQILQTDQYEFITFTPTAITGLPQQGAVGQSYSFQMAGTLTIRDVSKPVTFAVTIMPTSATQLKGSATATISRADFGLTIPQVRQVASVSDQVKLAIDFVAVAK